LHILKSHFSSLKSTISNYWYNFSMENCFFTREKKVAIWLSYRPYKETHHLMLLFDIASETLLHTQYFFSEIDPSAFGYNSSMATLVEKVGTDDFENTETMEVKVSVFLSSENFSQKRALCQLSCAVGELVNCVVWDNIIWFGVIYKGSNKLLWSRLLLSEDLTSVITQDPIFHSTNSIQVLRSGQACFIMENELFLHLNRNGQSKDISLGVKSYLQKDSQSFDGKFVLIFDSVIRERKIMKTTIALFDQMGNIQWKKEFKDDTFSPCSVMLLKNVILIPCHDNFLYVFDTKRDSFAKHRLWPGETSESIEIIVNNNNLITFKMDSSSSYKMIDFKYWNLH